MKPLDALRRSSWIGALLLSAALAACNGGDDPAPTPTGVSGTLAGTAATGAAISGGTVEVKCAAGPDPTPATTSAAGAWTVTVSGVTLPCKVKVSGGNLPSGAAYHSIAVDLGTVNVTPLTDLIVANLTGQAPATWYAGVTPADLGKITATAVNAAVGNVRTAINVAAFSNSVDPITTALAIGDAVDKILDALKVAVPDYAALLTAAQGQNFASTFASTYATALSNALSGGGTGGGGSGGNGTPFTSGPGYAIAYTAPTIGIDGRSPVTANFDTTSGALTGWQWEGAFPTGAEAPTIGTLSTSDLHIDGALTLGRWGNGTLGGSYYSLPPLVLQPNGALHWVVGRATGAPPTTGVVTYNVSKATTPTFGNPLTGQVVVPLAGSITVDFASGKVALDLSFSYGSGAYTVKTTGGIANPSASEVAIDTSARSEFSGAGQISTAASTGTTGYMTYVRGFFAGTSADQIALALRVDNQQGGSWASMTASLRQATSGGGTGGTGGGTTNPLLTAASCSPGITTGFSLVAEVTVAGVVSTPICVDGLSAKPATEAEFCGNSEFRQGLPPGVTINSCSYTPSSGVADVTATLTAAPGVPGVSYTVKYTFIPRS